MQQYNTIILGAGVAGVFSALTIAKKYKNAKTLMIDIGRGPLKRRRQIEGFLGCLPNSDGKLYLSDVDRVASITGSKKANGAQKQVYSILKEYCDLSITKDKGPYVNIKKKIEKAGYQLTLNDYIQIFPKEIHELAKSCSSLFENCPQIDFSYDNKILSLSKEKDTFLVETEDSTFKAKNVILATGRSGWRWNAKVYQDFGLVTSNDYAKFGVRIEIPSQYVKEFNNSSCSLEKDNIEIGNFSWNGTVIPEDHADMAICSFRSNESRWESSKLSFSIIAKQHFKNNGIEQIERIGKLTFLLANDRISKEKISTLLNEKSKISILKEYSWVPNIVRNLNQIIPELTSKGSFHVPDLITMIPEINIANDLSTDLEGLYVVGEAAGVRGILSAAMMGVIAADSIYKG